jgi:UDP-N-acetylglucosamine 1-carboxyvinyltransferase
VALLATADGSSVVRETLFEGRMECARQMTRLGADIKVVDSTAYITGCKGLLRGGSRAEGTDLRATAALAIAGLAADGETIVGGMKYLVRGYEGFEAKLQAVGADIRRIKDVSAEQAAQAVRAEQQ